MSLPVALNSVERSQALRFLWTLKRRETPFDQTMHTGRGICHQMTVARDQGWLSYRGITELKYWMLHWPEYSGSPGYPVPAPKSIGISPAATAEYWYDQHAAPFGQMWSGKYGGTRIRLLNFLIRTLEAQDAE